MNKQRIVLLVSALVGVLSTFLNWGQAKALFLTNTFSIFDKDLKVFGWIIVMCFGLAAVFSVIGDRKKSVEGLSKVLVLIGGILSFIIVIFLILVWKNEGFTLYYGIYLCLLTTLSLTIFPFIMKGNGDFEVPSKDEFVADLKGMKDEIVEETKELKETVEDKFDKLEDKIEDKLDKNND